MNSQTHHSSDGRSGAAVDYHFWATGVPSANRVLPPTARQPDTARMWQPLPQAVFNEYILKGTSIEHSLKSQEDWHFSDVGQGALTFEVKNAGGNLVIALSGWNHSDIQGYYIVLDDDAHESYVMKVATMGNDGLLRNTAGDASVSGTRRYAKVQSGVYTDPTFRLDQTTPQRFWVLYQHGTIVVGTGVLGVGRQILYMTPEEGRRRNNGSDLYHYGFGRFGSRWTGPITVQDTTAYTYTPAPLFPLPDNKLLEVVKPLSTLANQSSPLYRGSPAAAAKSTYIPTRTTANANSRVQITK
jgi:hypothetical protein